MTRSFTCSLLLLLEDSPRQSHPNCDALEGGSILRVKVESDVAPRYEHACHRGAKNHHPSARSTLFAPESPKLILWQKRQLPRAQAAFESQPTEPRGYIYLYIYILITRRRPGNVDPSWKHVAQRGGGCGSLLREQDETSPSSRY